MMRNGLFWANHFRRVNVRSVEAFRRAVFDRVLPTFNSISAEADAVAEQRLGQLGQTSAGPSFEGDIAAEQAMDAGLEYYVAMTGVYQALINALTVFLHHLFEQQLCFFLRKNFLWEPRGGENLLDVIIERLGGCGVDCKGLDGRPKLGELRLVANTVKHAEGRSSRELSVLRPDLFEAPDLKGLGLQAGRPTAKRVSLPLAGQDLYATPGDLASYFDAVARFWKELAAALETSNGRACV
jgi:hypothetical protein